MTFVAGGLPCLKYWFTLPVDAFVAIEYATVSLVVVASRAVM